MYVADYSSAAVSVVDGSACNAEVTRGCATAVFEQPVSSGPTVLAVSPTTSTVYTSFGAMSIFATAP